MKSKFTFNSQLQLQLASGSSEMCQGVEQGAPQQVAGVEKEKERKEIRDRIKHMITGLAGPKAFLSTSVRRWRESLCVVLQLSSGVAWRRGVGRLDMHRDVHGATASSASTSWLVQKVVARRG